MKNKFYVCLPVYIVVTCGFILSTLFTILLASTVDEDEYLYFVLWIIFSVLGTGLLFLYVNLVFINVIEIGDNSIKRYRFNKLIKEIKFSEIADVGNTFKTDTGPWCYFSTEIIKKKRCTHLRLNKNCICFMYSEKAKEVIENSLLSEDIKKKIFS